MGAGAPVFNTRKSEPAKDRKGAEEEAEGEEEYDPHYEPVIPLPEAVVSSTGEEDEAILFNERTKLFRYDVALREWKERGVGQFKILHHPVNGKCFFGYLFLKYLNQILTYVYYLYSIESMTFKEMNYRTTIKYNFEMQMYFFFAGLQLEMITIIVKYIPNVPENF